MNTDGRRTYRYQPDDRDPMTFDHRLHNMFNPAYYTINFEEDVLPPPDQPIFVTREEFRQPRPQARRTFLYGLPEPVVLDSPYVNMSQVRELAEVHALSPIQSLTPTASKKEEDESIH